MDPLLICYLYVTSMDPLLLCYLYVTSMDPLLLCYLLNAFACVVLCFCMWVYLRSTYKDQYARKYAELIMWNEIHERQVREYQDIVTRMKNDHEERVQSVTETYFYSELSATVRLRGIIKSLKSELGVLRDDRDKLLLDWADQVKHTKAHAWVPELLPTSQAGSP